MRRYWPYAVARRYPKRGYYGYARRPWNRFVWAFRSAPGRWLHDHDCEQCAEARRKWGA